ncbi:hypothetical protein BCR44DRAFT_1266846 [Catenaria anguillulae PL171]|uniref:Uncharacterized protein n=1 Tax=Catenaria anguillulae PL171 TaxID=765915 RepID=A0A1Y2HZ94_9FUNG|nr:hypothetical protein BCR44DRAFT_1266846 [Catenaria anguillulae PL171]
MSNKLDKMNHTDHPLHISGPRGAQRYRDPLTTRHVKVHQSLNALHQGTKPAPPLPVHQEATSRSVNALDSGSGPSSASHRATGTDGERRQSKVRIKLSKSQSDELMVPKTLDALAGHSGSTSAKHSDPQLAHVRPIRPPSVLKESNHFRMRPSLTKSLDALTAGTKRATAHSASHTASGSTSVLSENHAHNVASRPAFAPVAPQTQPPPARRRRASLPNPERPSFVAGHGHAMPTIHDGVVTGSRRSRGSTVTATNSLPFANVDQETQRAISASSQHHGHVDSTHNPQPDGEVEQRWPADIPLVWSHQQPHNWLRSSCALPCLSMYKNTSMIIHIKRKVNVALDVLLFLSIPMTILVLGTLLPRRIAPSLHWQRASNYQHALPQ